MTISSLRFSENNTPVDIGQFPKLIDTRVEFTPGTIHSARRLDEVVTHDLAISQALLTNMSPIPQNASNETVEFSTLIATYLTGTVATLTQYSERLQSIIKRQ
jgi:hypothetical protein